VTATASGFRSYPGYTVAGIRMVWDALKAKAQELQPARLPQSTLGKALNYFLNEYDALAGYLREGRFEIDNNGQENAKGQLQKEVALTRRKSQSKVIRATGKSKPTPAPIIEKPPPVDWEAFLAGITRGKTVLEYGADRTSYRQGDPADSIFYIRQARVKRTVGSQQGKEAIVGILGDDEFFGEGCLAGQPLRISSAIAASDCTLYRIEKALMVRVLHELHGISELFITHLLSRNIRFDEDLVDQLFNPSEKRLARILLLLAHFGKESRTETVHPGINQEHLAQMLGTTRSRVSHFMNKFRTLGFIDYAGSGALTVNNGLLSVILSE
jgi:CRP/FNR family transcriptional regulator, cyclic AMP receptor protein